MSDRSCKSGISDAETIIQGDPSGSSQPPVDIKWKVAFQYMLLIQKCNFCFNVNRRLGTTRLVTLYKYFRVSNLLVDLGWADFDFSVHLSA